MIALIIAALVWTEAREYLYGEAGYEFSVDRGVAHDLQLNFDATVATPCHCELFVGDGGRGRGRADARCTQT